MSDEPDKIEHTLGDAAKAVNLTAATMKAAGWAWGVHCAVWGHVASTAHRWRMNAQDAIKANWVAIWGTIASVAYMVANYVIDNVVPALQRDGKNIAIAVLFAVAAQIVISLTTGGKAPPKKIQPPMKAVPDDEW